MKRKIKYLFVVFSGIFLLSCTYSANNTDYILLKENFAVKDTTKIMVSQNSKISILDTIIDTNKIKINWSINGKIELFVNQNSDSINWFSYDEYADKIDHSSIIQADKNKPLNIVVTDSFLIFSIVDFKGRAALFLANRFANGNVKFANSIDDCINPMINESSFVFIDLKRKIIINNGGKYQLNDTLFGNSYNIYTYILSDGCIKHKNSYQSYNKKLMRSKNLDLSTFDDAKKFYTIIIGDLR